MSINTNMTRKSPQLRTISDPVVNNAPSGSKQQEVTEVEISLPALLVIVAAIGLLIYGAIYFFGPKKTDSNNKVQPETIEQSLADINNVSLKDLDFTGNEKANYALVVLSDPECPACQYYSQGTTGVKSIEEQVKKTYVDSGIVRYGHVPYVLIPSHKPAATNEVVGYYCARDQGKAQEFMTAVFQKTATNGLGIDGKGSERVAIMSLAKQLQLDEGKFASCYDKRDIVTIGTLEERMNTEIRKPWTDQKGEFFGTPAFLICKVNQETNSCSGQAFVGAFPFDTMKTALDKFLGADAPK